MTLTIIIELLSWLYTYLLVPVGSIAGTLLVINKTFSFFYSWYSNRNIRLKKVRDLKFCLEFVRAMPQYLIRTAHEVGDGKQEVFSAKYSLVFTDNKGLKREAVKDFKSHDYINEIAINGNKTFLHRNVELIKFDDVEDIHIEIEKGSYTSYWMKKGQFLDEGLKNKATAAMKDLSEKIAYDHYKYRTTCLSKYSYQMGDGEGNDTATNTFGEKYLIRGIRPATTIQY